MTRYILCPLANDVEEKGNQYVSIGANGAKRIADAVKWYEQSGLNNVLWAFGAGTKAGFESGPTLAVLSEIELRKHIPTAQTCTNRNDYGAFGTYEEFAWIVGTVEAQSRDENCFIVFTQARHIRRFELIKFLFFRNKCIKTVLTGATKEVPLLHEVFAYGKLLSIWCGFGRLASNFRRNVKIKFDRN